MFPEPPPTVGSVCSHVGTGVGPVGVWVGPGDGDGVGPGDGDGVGPGDGTGDGSGDGAGVGAKVGVGLGSRLSVVGRLGAEVTVSGVGPGVRGRVVGDGDGRHEMSVVGG